MKKFGWIEENPKTLSIHDLIEEKYPAALKTLNGLLKINPRLYDVHQNWVISERVC